MSRAAHVAAGVHASRSLLDGLVAGALEIDRDGRIRYANHAASTMLGLPEGRPVDATLLDLAADEPSTGAISEVLGHALDGERWRGELVLTGSSTGRQRYATTWSPHRLDGEPSVVVTLEPLSSRTDDAAHLSARLRRLAQVSAELLQATSVEGVVTVMTDHLARQ